MSQRAMLIPKRSRRRRFFPALPDWELNHVVGDLAPRERKALAHICETADLLTVDEEPWLLVPADPRLLDTLAVFGAEAEDREMDLEDEPQADDEPSLGGLECINQQAWAHGCCSSDAELDDCDKEPDDPEARERFTRARQDRASPTTASRMAATTPARTGTSSAGWRGPWPSGPQPADR